MTTNHKQIKPRSLEAIFLPHTHSIKPSSFISILIAPAHVQLGMSGQRRKTFARKHAWNTCPPQPSRTGVIFQSMGRERLMAEAFTEEELSPWQEVPLCVTHSHGDPQTSTLHKLDSSAELILTYV